VSTPNFVIEAEKKDPTIYNTWVIDYHPKFQYVEHLANGSFIIRECQPNKVFLRYQVNDKNERDGLYIVCDPNGLPYHISYYLANKLIWSKSIMNLPVPIELVWDFNTAVGLRHLSGGTHLGLKTKGCPARTINWKFETKQYE
jgi:hypothetical protein